MKPPPKLTVSEWADRYRRLSPESSAEPGQWRTSRAEYQRGIMDAISDPSVTDVVVKKSAQIGWTEILNNICAYHIDQDPAPMLMIQPSVEMGEAWSKDRFAPMVRDTKRISDRVGESRSRQSGNTILHKSFPGGHLTIAGANSPASLASRPIRIVLFDEVNRYPPSAGSEGDPVSLARKRSTTFWNRKTLMGSTPTTKGRSRITTAFDTSDQRYYFVPCPHCGAKQKLQWKNVRWQRNNPATALYHCEECPVGWTDRERWAAVGKGEWRATQEFRGVAGFFINELYSPWVQLEETVGNFLKAKDDPQLLKTWTNTALGEDWEEQGEVPEWERLIERRENFPMGIVPERAVVLTAGVDYQRDRLECDVWAWGPGFESWFIDTKAFHGDPSTDAPWEELREWLDRPFKHSGNPPLMISKIGVDTGGTDTQSAYKALRAWRDSRLMPLKGASGWTRTAPISGPTSVDVTVGGKKFKKGLHLWTVAVDTFKSELYRFLWLTRGDGVGYPKGWVHLPQDMDPEHVKQLVAEQLVTVKGKKGFVKYEWAKIRDRNERLDCRNYARAALMLLGADRYGESFWARLRRATVVENISPEQSSVDPAPANRYTPRAQARRVGRANYLSRIGR